MRRILAVLLISVLGCGGVSFRGTFLPDNTVFTVSGFVTFIEFRTFRESRIAVTTVTFLPDFGRDTTVIFCGDLTQELFLDDFATVDFTEGLDCATAVGIFVD
jgi:hypothetical protein